MGSATRNALAAATAELDAAKGVKLATGEQLLAAGRAIAGSTQLRAVLSDRSIPETNKSGLLAAIFPKQDALAATLLAGIIGSRWSDSDELVDGIESVGIRALAAAAGKDAGIEGELFAVGRAISSDHDLELALGGKLGDPSAKSALMEKLVGKKASPATLAILTHLVQSPRGRRIGELLSGAAEAVAEASNRQIATVTAAVPLSAAQQKRLATALTSQYGIETRIDVIVDPSVLGGLRVQVGDEVVDGTVSARLTDLRLQLAG
ncbi:F0F1 ATP synthase subunit delta [Pseudolysinimonas sp.]|jgi:F-type H+-transporting ATPase subunit delta|uniref:F0F1 ATP synthase subunit delta n=1 Tax=Pseudolysinimonas sp. TaxID=2680009 RepID=UPI003784B71B